MQLLEDSCLHIDFRVLAKNSISENILTVLGTHKGKDRSLDPDKYGTSSVI